MLFSVVDFPEPLGPIMQTSSPRPTSRVIPCRMSSLPWPAWMSRTWRSILSAAKVGLHDSLIFQNNFRRPFGKFFSVVEDENLFGEIHDDLHVVLDDQDGFAACAKIADGAQEIVEQTPINAGGGFIQKNQIWINHQNPGEL